MNWKKQSTNINVGTVSVKYRKVSVIPGMERSYAKDIKPAL